MPNLTLPKPGTNAGATLSSDGVYRYILIRQWGRASKFIAWIMLNPSTADATYDDATIRRCTNFSKTWGYDGMQVYNLFALRATNPKELYVHPDPVGPNNDNYLIKLPLEFPLVLAWGSHADYFPKRLRQVLRIFQGRREVNHLGLSATGQPKHPLRLASSSSLILWQDAKLPACLGGKLWD